MQVQTKPLQSNLPSFPELQIGDPDFAEDDRTPCTCGASCSSRDLCRINTAPSTSELCEWSLVSTNPSICNQMTFIEIGAKKLTIMLFRMAGLCN